MIDAMAAKYCHRSLFIEHPYARWVADIRLMAIPFRGSRPLSQIQIGRLSGCRGASALRARIDWFAREYSSQLTPKVVSGIHRPLYAPRPQRRCEAIHISFFNGGNYGRVFTVLTDCAATEYAPGLRSSPGVPAPSTRAMPILGFAGIGFMA